MEEEKKIEESPLTTESVDDILAKHGLEKEPEEEIDLSSIEKEVNFDFDKRIEDAEKAEEAIVLDDNDEDDEEPVKPAAKKVDISKLKLVNATVLDREQDLKAVLYSGKTLSQIVAAQSGYMAKLVPLVNKDVVNLLYSNLTRYEYRKTVFKVIYDKIVAISSYPHGKPSFEEWLKCTSTEDIETFYYGLYCATFPNMGKFTYTCPECDSDHVVSVDNRSLFKTANKTEMKKRIRDINANSLTKDAMQKYSLIGKTDAFELTNSKIIAEIRTPSLWDSLELLRVVSPEVIDRNTSNVTNMLYIRRMLLPSKSMSDGYSEQYDPQTILQIIDNLSIDDAAELKNAVSDRVDANRITYTIKNIKCPVCGYKAEETPISIENVLFTLIFERAQ